MPENTSRSFVVRIWIEPREIPNQTFEWRGLIQDAMSGQSKYFREFDEMIAFIILYMSQDIQKEKGSKQ